MELKEVIELHEFLNRKEEGMEELIEERIGELFDEIRELEMEISDIKETIENMPLYRKDYDDLPFSRVEEIPLF